MGLIEWATSPWGRGSPDPHRVWPVVGVGDRRVVVSDRSRHLRAVLGKIRTSACRQLWASRRSRRPHSRASRAALLWRAAVPLDHGAAMFALLFTAFLPKVACKFAWVTYHWIAGIVLTVSVIFHIIHATFCLDFWSIWPDQADIEDASQKVAARVGPGRAGAAKVRQVSAGKQAVSPGHRVRGSRRHRDRRLHDEARAHAFLHAQSVSLRAT